MRGSVALTALGLVTAGGGGLWAQQAPTPEHTTRRVRIPRETLIVLMATREVRSDQVVPGATFPLRVDQPVRIDGMIVIPVGTPAAGEVVSATASGILGRNGALTLRLRFIQLGDARIPLSGEFSSRGRSVSPVATVRVAGPVGLFHPGNNGRLKAGDVVEARVAEDVTLDLVADSIRRTTP